MRVYLDNAATTPLYPEVVEIITEQLLKNYGNPSSTHSHGRDSKVSLEESRRKIAKILNAKPSEITFTSCGTESNNTILKNAFSNLGITRILTTPIEHPSIKNTVENLSSSAQIEYIKLQPNGEVDYNHLEELLKQSNEPTLVSIMHANNEMGVMNDLIKIGTLVKGSGAYFHSDMVQTIGHSPIDFNKILVDFASASAHKFHGPKGVGFLYVRNPIKINSLISGGSQERGLRSGTENLASIVGMARAMELSTQNLENDIQYINSLKSLMRTELVKVHSGIQFLTPESPALCTVLSVIFPADFECDMLIFQLDLKGISCSGGSACSSGAEKKSHVLEQFNIPQNAKVVRFSFSKFNTPEEILYSVEQIKSLLKESVKATV